MPSPIKQFTINSLRRQTWKRLGTFRGKDSATVVLGGLCCQKAQIFVDYSM